MPREPVYEGRKLTIQFVEFADGSCPAGEFLDSLDDSDLIKLQPVFQRIGDHGEYYNRERFKKVEGSDGIFEIKSYQIRILGFFTPAQQFLLVDGLRKKKDKLRRSDIKKAETIRANYLKALEGER